MLGVEAEVSVFPRHIAGIDVVVLVPCDGIPVNREGKLKKEDGKKSGNA
jgi:hypothetical protein